MTEIFRRSDPQNGSQFGGEGGAFGDVGRWQEGEEGWRKEEGWGEEEEEIRQP